MLTLRFDPNATFYHGTVDLYGELIQEIGIKVFETTDIGLDFGAGFYLSQENKLQVMELARHRAKKPSIPRIEILELLGMSSSEFLKVRKKLLPTVLSFRIKSVKMWEELKLQKEFPKDNYSWKEYVNKYRKTYQAQTEYHTTFGPVADGGIFSGFAHKIVAHPNMNQLAIHSQKAADLFELTNLEVIK